MRDGLERGLGCHGFVRVHEPRDRGGACDPGDAADDGDARERKSRDRGHDEECLARFVAIERDAHDEGDNHSVPYAPPYDPVFRALGQEVGDANAIRDRRRREIRQAFNRIRDERRAGEDARTVHVGSALEAPRDPDGDQHEEDEVPQMAPEQPRFGGVEEPGNQPVDEALAAGEDGAVALIEDGARELAKGVGEGSLVEREHTVGGAKEIPAVDEIVTGDPQCEDVRERQPVDHPRNKAEEHGGRG